MTTNNTWIPDRVLIVSATTLIPDTGAKTRLVVTLRALRQLGVATIDLLALESPSMLRSRAELQRVHRQFSDHGVDLHVRPLPSKRGPGGRLTMVRGAALYCRSWIRRRHPDLLVAVNSDAAAACAMSRAAEANPAVHLLEFHGIESEEAIFGGSVVRDSLDHERRQLIERMALGWADVVVAPTKEAVDWAAATHDGDADWRELPTLSPMRVSAEDRAEFRHRTRDRLGWGENRVLLYVGGMNPWQQPELMAELFTRLHGHDSRWRFLAVTQDVEQANEHLAAAGAESHTIHVVSADSDGVAELGCAGDVALLLRQPHLMNRVASPTKLGEYLKMGVPVALTDALPSAARIVRDERVGAVLEGAVDLERACERIQDLAAAGDREEVAQRCRRTAGTHFDESSATDLYRSVLDTHGPTAEKP